MEKNNLFEKYYEEGVNFYNNKKYEDALNSFYKALEYNTNFAKIYLYIGVSKLVLGRIKKLCLSLIKL